MFVMSEIRIPSSPQKTKQFRIDPDGFGNQTYAVQKPCDIRQSCPQAAFSGGRTRSKAGPRPRLTAPQRPRLWASTGHIQLPHGHGFVCSVEPDAEPRA